MDQTLKPAETVPELLKLYADTLIAPTDMYIVWNTFLPRVDLDTRYDIIAEAVALNLDAHRTTLHIISKTRQWSLKCLILAQSISKISQ